MNGKINQIAAKAQELSKRLLPKRRYIEKVEMPKGVEVYYN